MKIKRIIAIIVLFSLVLSFAPVLARPERAYAMINSAQADGYSITVNGATMSFGTTYPHSSTATVSYHTVGLLFTLVDSNGNPTSVKNQYVPVTNPLNPNTDYTDGDVYMPFYADTDAVRSAIAKLTNNQKGNIEVYVSQVFRLKERTKRADGTFTSWRLTGGQLKTLSAIQGAANWSSGTFLAFPRYFDVRMTLNLVSYSVTVTEMPTKGGNTSVYTTGDAEAQIVGDAVKVSATVNKGYEFSHWEVVKPSGGLSDIDGSKDLSISFIMPESDVELIAHFISLEPEELVTNAPIASVTPIPKKTLTPAVTAAPTATPKPSPIPAYFPEFNADERHGATKYYTTDMGYTLEGLYNKDLPLAGNKNESSAGSTLSSDITHQESYALGTETGTNNTWYFIPNGNNATYVHPCTYNGIDCISADIRYVQHITFPSTIKYNGVNYTVTSIGGGGRGYINDGGKARVSYGDVSPSSSYDEKMVLYDGDMCVYRDSVLISEGLTYVYGLAGNGEIMSEGLFTEDWFKYENNKVETRYNRRLYENKYIVYNTTLATVTIPNSVTTIEPYAFAYCQALTEIKGGNGLVTIAHNAFEGATELTAKQSSAFINGLGVQNVYYYYNEEYSLSQKTARMLEFEKTAAFSERMGLPALTALLTIEEEGFINRTNLLNIEFPATLNKIGVNAFSGCKLYSITLPGVTKIGGGSATLGTRGKNRVTTIITEPDTPAMNYGIANDDYYKLRCGYDVVYDNNFSPEQTHETISALAYRYVEEQKRVLNGTYFIDTNGDLYERSGLKHILTDYKFKELYQYGPWTGNARSSQSSAGPARYFLYVAIAETGEVFTKYTGIFPSAMDPLLVDGWLDLNVPKGAFGHQIYLHVESEKSSSSQSSSSGASGGSGDASMTHYNCYYATESGLYCISLLRDYDSDNESWSSASGTTSYWYSSVRTVNIGPVLPDTLRANPDVYSASPVKIPTPTGITIKDFTLTRNGSTVKSENSTNHSGENSSTSGSVSYDNPSIVIVDQNGTSHYGKSWQFFNKESDANYFITTLDYYPRKPISAKTKWQGPSYSYFPDEATWKKLGDSTASFDSKTLYNWFTGTEKIADVFAPMHSSASPDGVFVITAKGDLWYYDSSAITTGYTSTANISDPLGTYAYGESWRVANGVAAGTEIQSCFGTAFVTGKNFVSAERLNDVYMLLTDKNGAQYLMSMIRNTSSTATVPYTAPKKLWDAGVSIKKCWDINATADASGSGNVNMYGFSFASTIFVWDSTDRLWRFSVSGSNPSVTLLCSDVAKVSKIDNNWYVYSNEGHSSWNPYAMIILDKNGDVYGYGTSGSIMSGSYTSTGEKLQDLFGMSTTVPYNSCVKIVSGKNIVDVGIFKATSVNSYTPPGAYTLIQDDKGNVYVSGTGGELLDPVVSTKISTYTLTPLDRIKETTKLQVGHYFYEKVYENIFERNPELYRFTHWTTTENDSDNGYIPGQIVELTSDTRFYAQWGTPYYEIYYNANGGYGAMNADIYPMSQPNVILTPNAFTRSGHEYLGWNTEPDGSGTSFSDKASINFKTRSEQTLVLYAQWNEIKTYTVYVADSPYRYGESPTLDTSKTMVLKRGESKPAPSPKTMLVSSTVSFYPNKQGTMTDGDIICLSGNLGSMVANTTFSFWELRAADGEWYSTYNIGDEIINANKRADSVLYLYPVYTGGQLTLPMLECEGYDFLGWTIGDTGLPCGSFANPSVTGEKYETEDEMVNAIGNTFIYEGDMTYTPGRTQEKMYAYWRPYAYDVNLVLDAPGMESGDITNVPTTLRVYYDEVIPSITPPTSDIFVLIGGFSGKDGVGTQYLDENGAGCRVWGKDDVLINTIYLYMVAEREVRLDNQGATISGTLSTIMKFKEMPKDIIPPEKTGYLFGGYFTEKKGSGTQYYDVNGKGTKIWTEKDTDVLYAKWTPITYTVKINYGAGSHPENLTSFTATYDKAFSVSHPYADRPGYKFTGWNISNSKGSLPPGNMQTEFINLTDVDKSTVHFIGTYAWADDIYLITFVANPLDYQLLSTDVVFNEWTANGKVSQTDTVCTGYYLTVGGNSSGLYDKSQTPYGGAFPTFKATAGTTKPNGASTFVGWNTSPDGSGTFYTSAPAVTNAERGLVLYAIWSDAVQASMASDASVNDWTNRDVSVTLSGESDISGVYRMELLMKSTAGTDFIETEWFPADVPSYTVAATENFRGGRSDLSNDTALTYYNRDKRSLTAVYSHQGRFMVDGAVYARSEHNSYPVTGVSTTGNTSFKIDKTAPSVTTLVQQKSIEDFAEALQNGSVTDLTGKLTTYFEVNANDTAKAEYGAFINNTDVSGIHEVYVIITDADNSASQKRYDLTLNNSVITLDGTGILSGKYTANIDLYAEFPDAVGITCEIFVSDRAGNITKVTEQNLANFSVYAQIYNVNNNKNLSDGTAYFQAGEFGYVNIWTYGYVEGLSLDFGAVGEEAQREIEAGLLLPEYSLEFQEDDVRLYVDNTKNSNLVRVDGIRIPIYFELEAEEGSYHSDGTPRFKNFTGTMHVLARKKTSYATADDDFVIYDKISNDYHYRVWPLE